ncbi:MAG: DNA polymerase III subunit delta [Candidatus Gracilibacteria bacterium]|nr:DNA polymerase III subunit delta [Candidatus Gracilibacteria bacterium]
MKQVFLFIGEEEFLIKEKIKEWKKLSVDKYGEFNVTYASFDLPDRDVSGYLNQRCTEIASEILTPSFFGDKRVIFIENFPPKLTRPIEDSQRFFMRILSSLKELPEENVVIISSFLPDKRTKVYKELTKDYKTEIFNKFDNRELCEWILRRVAKYGGKMLPSASGFLAEYCAGDLYKIDQDIKKLVDYKGVEPISERDIESLCIKTSMVADFALANSMSDANVQKILTILHTELNAGSVPQMILFKDIAPTLRQLLQVIYAVEKDKDPKAIGMNPWVFNRWKSVSKKFTLNEIKEAYLKILEIDEGMKTGKIETSLNDYRMFMLFIEKFFWEMFGAGFKKA